MKDSNYRELSKDELKILNRLLQSSFPGSSEIRIQLVESRVETIDENGSLSFRILSGQRAEVLNRIPVEAETNDKDGVPVFLLLHVVDGYISELEIYRADSKRIISPIDPDALKVIVSGEENS